MTPLPPRPLVAVEVAPGPAGVIAVQQALCARLDDDGPAFAMVPALSRHVTQGYVDLVRSAVAVDGPDLEDADTAVVVATSGSTGSPRGVLITGANLRAAWIAGNAARPGLADCGWVLALPVTSAGGFAALVRAHLSGRRLAVLDSVGGAAPFQVSDLLALEVTEPFALSLVPSQVAAILASPEGSAWLARAHSVIVGAAATPPELVEQARAAGIAIFPSYGMTETTGGCVYDGEPLPGMTVELEADPRAEQDGAGRVVLRGPLVAAGYRCEPEQTASAFSGQAPARAFRTQDLAVWEDGRLRVLGRLDDVVMVHGVNVSLGSIESLARSELGVADVAVIAVPDSERGHRILAITVAPHAATRAALGPLIAERLGPLARPEVVAADALPYLPNGKIDRLALRERYA